MMFIEEDFCLEFSSLTIFKSISCHVSERYEITERHTVKVIVAESSQLLTFPREKKIFISIGEFLVVEFAKLGS